MMWIEIPELKKPVELNARSTFTGMINMECIDKLILSCF